MKRYIWGILYGLALAAFTAYVLLDTFVITRVYSYEAEDSTKTAHNATDNTTDNAADNVAGDDTNNIAKTENTGNSTTIITDTSYKDANISITVTEYRQYDTSIYVADVTLASAEYLKTAFAKSSYGKNVTAKTSEIAASNNAILAINGDYYGVQEKGYVLRNGTLYRSTAVSGNEDLVIYNDGAFSVINESTVSAESLLSAGAKHILSFGPALVTNGAVSVTTTEEVGKAMTSNPRTAIGIIDELHYLLVVSDGRTGESEGLTLYQLATFMQSMDCTMAYNLDGGGSSTMYFNGTVINNPTTNGKSIKERSVSDIVYIGY